MKDVKKLVSFSLLSLHPVTRLFLLLLVIGTVRIASGKVVDERNVLLPKQEVLGSTNPSNFVVQAGEVLIIKGKVTITRDGVTIPLTAGAAIYVGDVIATGSGSFVKSRFPDGSEVGLGPSSSVKVDQGCVYKKSMLQLLKGYIRSQVISGNDYHVRTESAALGVRGTDFTVEYEEVNGCAITTIYVFEGIVEATKNANGEMTTLNAGESLQVISSLGSAWAAVSAKTWESTAPGSNGYWTNSVNWSASPYPSLADTALFCNDGNGRRQIDLDGLPSIKSITYCTSAVGAYTNGTGEANSQTLVLADGGEIALSANAGNSQVFNCGVQLGLDRTAQTYSFRNDNPSQSLTFNDVFFVRQEVGGNLGNKTLAINGTGPVSILGSIRQNGISTLYLYVNNSDTVTLGGSNVVTALYMYGGPSSVIDIGSQELVLNSNGGNVLNCYLGGTITGAGKLRLSTWDGYSSAGYNYADLNVVAGKTLTINCEITGPGGFESNSGTGTFVLNGTNTFLGHLDLATAGGTISVSTIGKRGVASNCGMGTNLYFANTSRLNYTGTGETSDRVIVLNSDARIEQAGPGGKLTFNASPVLLQSKTLTLQGSTAGVGEFSAPLVNTGANTLTVVKQGSGTWILSATNTYTGATTVNGGTLVVTGSGSLRSAVTVNTGAVLAGSGTLGGTVNVAAGGLLAPGGVTEAGTLSLTNNSATSLTLNGNTLFFDVSNVATDKLDITGTSGRVVVNGTNTIAVSFPSGSAQAGTYTLMSFYGRTGSGTFVLSPAYPNVALVTNATSVQVVVGPGDASPVLWKGNVSDKWDGTDLNWTSNGVAGVFSPGDQVVFDDSATSFSVAGSAPVNPGSVLFNNSLEDYSVSATIEGAGVVYKLGSGAVTLTGNNTFTGAITVAGGTFKVGGEGVLGEGNYATNLVNNGELIYASSTSQINSGVISGGGNLTQCGSGMLTLSGNNTFVGNTIVTSGVLRVLHPNGLGSTALGTFVAAGATLDFAGTIVTPAEAIDLYGTLSCSSGSNTISGIVSAEQGSTIYAAAGATLVINGSVPNIGSNLFTKTGPGLLRFTADPNPIGMFVIDEGSVELQHGGSTDINFTINPNGTLRQFTKDDLGDNYSIQANGILDFRNNDTVGGLSGSGVVTNSGSSAVAITVCNNNQSGVFSGVIRNGAGAATLAVTKTGSGFLTLSGASTFSGGFNFSAGQLNINNGGATSGESAVGIGTFTIGASLIDNTSGADVTLLPAVAQSWNSDFTFFGSKSLNLGSGNVTLGANRTVTVSNNTLTVGGAISGGFSLTKNGAGALVLNGANTYSGATTVNGGSLVVNGSTASGSAVMVNAGLLGGSGTINGMASLGIGSLLSPGGVGSVGTLTFANAAVTNLTLNGNTLLFDLSTVADACDKVKLTAAAAKLMLNGTNTVALSFPASGAPAGTYTLMTCPGGVITNSGAVLKLLTAYPNATLGMVSSNLVLTLSAPTTSGVAWTGEASGKWDGGALNWTADGSTSIAYPVGAGVTFGDTAANFSVSSDAAVSPATVLFTNSLNDYTVSAQLSGTSPFTKGGTAAVTLTGTSGYNPVSIVISDGPLAFCGDSQLNNGNYGGTIVNNSALVFSNANPQVLGGVISGGGILSTFGGATLTLAGSNFFSGVTTVNNGILKVTHPYGLGSTINGTFVNPGATLELAGNVSTLSEAVTLNGVLSSQSGTNTLNGTLTLNTGSSIDVGAGSLLVLKGFQANGPFTKTGAGWMRLTTDPNGNGFMTVQSGTAEIATGTMDASVLVNNGATLVATIANAFNDTMTHIQLDAGSTYILRQWDQIGGLSGAGLITQDTGAQAWLCIGANGFSETFSGSMQNGAGVLGLAKIGIGVQTLTGASTYTGATIAGQGTLLVNSPGSLAGTAVTVSNTATFGGSGSVGGPVTCLSGGALIAGGLDTVGTLSLGSTLALNGNVLFFDLPASGTVCDTVAVAGALALEGLNTVVLSFPGGSVQAGDYTLLTFASRSGSGSFAPLTSYPNATLELTGTNLVLHVAGGGMSGLTWSGSLSPLWDGGALNWTKGGSASSFAANDAVLFDDSAAGQFTVSSAGNVAPSAITFNNSVNPYYVAAPITGTAPLVKSGTAMACINNSTAYNPAFITINAGTLLLANSAQFGSGTYAGNVIVNGTFNHYSGANLLMSGLLSGPGALAKTGGGTLTLNGTNAYLGGTTLTSGTLIGRGSPTVFGFGAFTASGGSLELQNNAALAFTNTVNLNSSTTFKVGRASQGAGVGHALGAMTCNNGDYTLTLSVGSNVDNNTPYSLTLGNVNLNGRALTCSVNNNGSGLGTLVLGSVSANNNMTKTGAGLLYLPVAGNSNRNSAGTTLNGGTLKLGAPGALGTSGATLTLTSGILDLAIDSSVSAHNTTVNGNVTCQSDRAAANAAGITHTLGTLSMGAYTLLVTNGPNVLANSVFGLTFGATTLTGNSVFDVADSGTLTLGAIGGNYTVTKRSHGTLKLAGANTYNAATTVNQGKLMGVTGGSSASSAVTLQSSLSANAVAKLSVLCATPGSSWTCNSLTFNAPAAPATTNPALEFAFSVPPSGTLAPLQVTGAATFTAAPSGLAVVLGSLSVTNGVYPLMTVGSAASKPVPALTVFGGYSGSALAWVGNTLYLTLNGSPSPLLWGTGAAGSGVWDVNNAGNLVWKDNTGAATSYQEPPGGLTGSRVVFDDSYVTADAAVTLNSIVSPAAIAFSNTTYKYTLAGGGGIAGTFVLPKFGTNQVTLATVNSYTGGTRVAEGTLKLASGGVISHAAGDCVVGASLATGALLRIESGASATGRWLTLGVTNGAVGAVYNQGALTVAGAANVTNFALGFATDAYGYYRHDTTTPLTMNETGIAGALGGNGVFDVLQGVITNSTYFQLNRGAGLQYAQVNVTGGRLLMPNNSAQAHLFYAAFASGQGVISVSGGGLLGSAGTATELDLIKSSTNIAASAVLNILSGGTVQATKVKASQGSGTALVNFNGGTLKANNNGYLLLGGTSIDRATVYDQGVNVDTDGKSASISQALLAPSGNGVTAVPVLAKGTGYIGRPVVTISGGGGVGATATADFDPVSQEVTGITVTSPGYNYTSAPTVTLTGGGGTPPALGTAAFGPVASGGLIKSGNGTLTLSGVNTYGGTTTISNGTLRLGVFNALPTNAVITVAGGTLDLNGFTLTNAAIDLISGSILNGRLLVPNLQGADSGVIQAQLTSTNGLTKNGDNTLTLTAPLTYPGQTVINGGTVQLVGRQPGLYEGRILGNAWDLSSANPKTATPLSTRYANLYFYDAAGSGGIWPDNTTFIYTGYLWNDAATNETWTFFKAFDDRARILINGTNVLQNEVSSAQVISNATVCAGWNTFELRLGEGSGAVGCNFAAFPGMGIGYDRKGRGQMVFANFSLLADPGDGSLLTLTNVFDLAAANILPTNSAVTIASGAALNLGGTGQRLGGLSGSGVVTNGALTVDGTIAPGGLLATGTLSLATSSAILSGTLRVDVTGSGACDVLAITGDLTLSGLALVVDAPGEMDPKKTYTIVTFTGARAGTFSSKVLPSGWAVFYESGEIQLRFVGGTQIRLR